MKRVLKCLFVMLVLALCVPLALMPVAATGILPGDTDGNDKLTEGELADSIMAYLDVTYLGGSADYLDLDELRDAAHVYAYWNGEPRRITDMADRDVTFYKPVKRVVCTASNLVRVVIALDACDRLVGIDQCSHPGNKRMDPLCFNSPVCAEQLCGGRLVELPDTGSSVGPGGHQIHLQEELIMSLKADVIFLTSDLYADVTQEKTGIPVVYLRSSGYMFEDVCESAEIMGMALETEGVAEELISFIKEEVNKISNITSQIPDSDKPTVFWGWTQCSFESTVGSNSVTLDRAGAINVAKDIPRGWGSVSKEQIIAWNPDIILIGAGSSNEAAAIRLKDVLDDPVYQNMTAVKNSDVYLVPLVHIAGSPQDINLFNLIYIAKLLHPEEFEDLDVEEEGNEIFKRFLRVDGLFTEYAKCNADWLRVRLDEQQKS